MSDKSGIQWTDATWNPVTGCSKVSQGCKNCYALRDWPRLSAPRPKPNAYTGREFTDVMFHPERLDQPLRWTKPRRVFVNSMSDLFHESVPDDWVARVLSMAWRCERHTFQVLTKRPNRMRRFVERWNRGEWFTRALMGAPLPIPNVWLGVSVEDQATADERIPLLLQTPAAVRFVSYEPALGPVSLQSYLECDLDRGLGEPWLDWVIVGGESGPRARPCDIDWIRSTVAQCKAASVPVFVKQMGANVTLSTDAIERMTGMRTVPHRWDLRDRKGGDVAEWPEDLRVREFPR